MQKTEIGKVSKLRGYKGEFVVNTDFDEVSGLLAIKKIYINGKEYSVEYLKNLRTKLGVKLVDVNSEEDARVFLSKSVEVNKDDIILSDNEYLTEDLLGCDVYDENHTFIGKVTDILNYGSSDIYVLDNNGEEVLFAYKDDIFTDIDIENKRITAESKILSEVKV